MSRVDRLPTRSRLTRRATFLVATLVVSTPLGDWTDAAVAHARASADAASILRDRIVAAFGRGRDPHLRITSRSSAEASKLGADRVDRRLIAGATAVEGRDFSFTAANGGKREIGLLTLRFPTAAVAARRARPLTGSDRHLSGTEIMTPMAVRASGNQVIVLFTESAGDRVVMSVLAATVARLSR